MQRKISGILLGTLLVVVALLVASCSKPTTASGGNTDAAVKFVQAMVDGKFTEATQQFDSQVSAAMSADQLKQTWAAVIAQYGAFKKMGETRTAQEGGFDEVFVPCEFANTTLDVKVVFDKDGKIGGLWFVPHVAASDSHYEAPKYVSSDKFDEAEVTVGSGEWKLPGTLSMPKGAGPFAALVLVHGSGPNDRDESVGANKPFRDIAQGLASRGIAVLRYDKRTKVYPGKMTAVKDMTVKEEVLDDAKAAADLLRNTSKIDPKRVFVLGHSLGGMLIPRIGKADPKLAGLIAMAGPTRPMEDIIIEQMQYLSSLHGPPSAEAKKKITELKAEMAKVKSPNLTAESPAILGAPASYWLDLRDYKPAEAARAVIQPLLVLQGGRDYQVTKDNYDLWQKALSGRTDVTFKFYPELNHLFMEGKGRSVPDEYTKRGPVPQYVINDIAAWIRGH